MAIRDWRRGQLVVLWIGVGGAAALAAWIGIALIDDATPTFCFAPCIPSREEVLMARVGAGFVVASIVTLITLLVVTWKWIGTRE